MAGWVLKGLRTGIRSSAYPGRPETAAGVSPGMPRRHQGRVSRRCGAPGAASARRGAIAAATPRSRWTRGAAFIAFAAHADE